MEENAMKDDKDFTEAPDTDSAEETSKGTINSDLIRGHINTIILRTLDERDKYGYEIIDEITEKSHGQYTMKQPTLYSALKRLESQGYIKAYWKTDEVSSGGRRKYFTLTELGREYSEKNQSEWEYSRTVIDSLISDRSFDFSQPAPTAVDFNILKKSVSRVYTGGEKESEGEDGKTEEKPIPSPVAEPKPDPQSEYAEKYAVIESSPVSEQYSRQTVTDMIVEAPPSRSAEENKAETAPVQSAENIRQAPPSGVPRQPIGEPTQQTYNYYGEQPQYGYAPYPPQGYVQQPEQTARNVLFAEQSAQSANDARSEEEKRITHENFLKLISEQDEKEGNIVPDSRSIDTDKLMYNNKPETERDYKKLIGNIYNKAIKEKQAPPPPARQPAYTEESASAAEQPAPSQAATSEISYISPSDEAYIKAREDGLKIRKSSSVTRNGTTKSTTYNKGAALFVSAAVASIVLIIEFIISLALMHTLNVGIMYPMTYLIVTLVMLAAFGVLFASGYGKGSVRPATHGYVSLCAVLSIICILVICLVSFLLDINLRSGTDIVVKIILPSIAALDITIFGTSYYFLSK